MYKRAGILNIVKAPSEQQKLEIIKQHEKQDHPNLAPFICKHCKVITWAATEPTEDCICQHPNKWPEGKEPTACFVGHLIWNNSRELLWLNKIEKCETCKNILANPPGLARKEMIKRIADDYEEGKPIPALGEKSARELLEEVRELEHQQRINDMAEAQYRASKRLEAEKKDVQ
jgi:hypothetical protein